MYRNKAREKIKGTRMLTINVMLWVPFIFC